MERESFQSRLGYILVCAGCAIGIGNVWRFPFVTGENGGGIFVLLYLFFLLTMGVPILTMELAVGRASRKSAHKGFEALEPAGSKWHMHGWAALAGNAILMMFYTTVSGWMCAYFYKFMTGKFVPGMTRDELDGVFGAMLSDPIEMTTWMAITVLFGFAVCSLGLEKGLERVSKYMMSALLLLIIVLAAHSLTLENASEGVAFYLIPDLDKLMSHGVTNVVVAAMNQAFFTLSLGIASMEIFGSYMDKDHTLMGESIRIGLLDTFVAIMSGLIIFPACFAYGVSPDAGPALIFMTLPNVFVNMAGGQLWGTMFFLFMTFASFSTVLAVFENLIAMCIDSFGWSRKQSVLICLSVILIGSMPCVLSFNLLAGTTIFGKEILDLEDFIVSNLLLPIGSLIFLLFCVSKWGWGFDKYYAEANTGEGVKVPRWIKPYLQFVLPIMLFIVIMEGLL